MNRKLASMPDYLQRVFAGLDGEQALLPGPGGFLSPVENCCHFADLEQLGFAVRISRLRGEQEPLLADIDGAGIALERGYDSLKLAEGLSALRSRRSATLATLAQVRDEEWERGRTQEGVGHVMLCDIPALMLEHDRGRREEIESCLRLHRGR